MACFSPVWVLLQPDRKNISCLPFSNNCETQGSSQKSQINHMKCVDSQQFCVPYETGLSWYDPAPLYNVIHNSPHTLLESVDRYFFQGVDVMKSQLWMPRMQVLVLPGGHQSVGALVHNVPIIFLSLTPEALHRLTLPNHMRRNNIFDDESSRDDRIHPPKNRPYGTIANII